ncbi:hypothetical protein DY000_02031404, partial [Brassica cretica]
TRSVNVSDLATVRDIQEFFSFSGNIDHIDILKNAEQSRVAFVSFPEPKALEIALLLFRKKEQHLFKWVDEALLDEIQRMDEQQS